MIATTILTCGMFSSASTWAFNAAVGLLRPNLRCGVGFVADLKPQDVLPSVPAGTVQVIKTHGWGKPGDFLDQHPGIRCIVTIRDPRDAVASLIQRFGYSFETAVDYAAWGADGIVAVAQRQNALLLRFETGFMDQLATLNAIADHLAISPSIETITRVFAELQPDAVSAAIAQAAREGRFPQGLPPGETADPVTQWHPRHIGDREIGKYARILTTEQQGTAVARMAKYMAHFGYLQ